jgi:hypothetical protein
MDVDRRSAHDIAANLVKPINSQTSKYRQNMNPTLNFLAQFSKKDKNPEKMNITSGPACIILSIASMLFK